MINEKTVVVINDSLGEIALTFQMAGFNVLCDALVDEKCMEIVQKNLGIEVLKLNQESWLEFPQAFVFAGRLAGDAFALTRSNKQGKVNYINQNIYTYITKNLPEIFFLETSKRFANSEEYDNFVRRFGEYGYRIEHKTLRAEEMTGIPIREERVYVMGFKNAEDIDFDIEFDKVNSVSWEEILDKRTEEPYLSCEKSWEMKSEGDGVYDWKNNHYEKSETVSLGWRIPRVVENGMIRSLSINETARIKGFPTDYLFLNKGKSWLKKMICSSANVLICRKIAEQFYKYISDCMNCERKSCSKATTDRKNSLSQGQEKASNREESIMERRYDVFVSSTYEDLIEERKEITQAVLECDCVPVGMEMFPASNMEQWEFIKKVIDKADIYLVIVAGKYGSIGVDEQGKRKSYTEMEFDYALRTGKPILAFLYKDINQLTGAKIELNAEKREALESFCKKIKKDRMVKFYTNKDELKANALSSINSLKKRITSGGWIRAEQAPIYEKNETGTKLEELQRSNEELKHTIQRQNEEKEQTIQQWKKTQVLLQGAAEREKEMTKRYEIVKMKIAELVDEMGLMK